MDHSSRWHDLFVEAGCRGGATTVADARRHGIADSTWFARVRREGWPDLGLGIRVVPGRPVTTTTLRWAALHGLGGESALSHATAATLHRLGVGDHRAGARVHTTVPYARSLVGPPWLAIHRSRVFDASDLTSIDGMTVTTVERTLVDVARGLSEWRLLALLLQQRQRGHLDQDALGHQLDRRGPVAGGARLRRVAAAAEGVDADSLFEFRTRELLVRNGLVPSPGPQPVEVGGGQELWVDLAFPAHRIAIECDGRAFHSSDEAHERDRTRWRLLREAHWTIVWLTWRRLHEHPAEVIAEVRQALAGAPRVFATAGPGADDRA